MCCKDKNIYLLKIYDVLHLLLCGNKSNRHPQQLSYIAISLKKVFYAPTSKREVMAVTMLSYAGNNKERIKKMAIEYESIGKRIKQFRTERNISQEKLGDLISATGNHISRIESGRRIPSVESLFLIANALNVTADDLLVDSLTRVKLTDDQEFKRLLAGCNEKERKILIRLLQFMKDLLKELL